jgi:hypothetical protein
VKMFIILAGGFATATVSAGLFGAGVAGAAPDVVGDTYSDAKTAIRQSGASAVVATRVGSGADEGDCIVTNAWDASFIREGRNANGREVMVALNCNSQVASAGKSGNSAASPAGREAKAAQQQADAAERRQLEAVSTPGA